MNPWTKSPPRAPKIVNLGGLIHFTEEHHFIFSAGTDIHGENLSRYYTAYQFTWGPEEKKR